MTLLLYIKAVLKHWWALMSCAAFTFLGIYVLDVHATNQWAVDAMFALAGCCLLTACFLAWRDEHATLLEVREREALIKKQFLDETPLLGLNVYSVEGPKAWVENAQPVKFSLQHLKGRIPTAIGFDPIPSKLGKFRIEFDPLPHLDPPRDRILQFEVVEVGAPALNANDRQVVQQYQSRLLGLFLDDSPMELLNLDYTLRAHFMDTGEKRFQDFRVTFEKGRYRFSAKIA